MAVHILSLIAINKDCTGDFIAGSVNTNPVVVRRLMGMLKRAGLVKIRSGVGGAALQKHQDEITLLDVYRAVEVIQEGQLFNFHDDPNPQCPVGRNIEAALRVEMLEAQSAMEQRLAQVTIGQLAAQFE